MQQSNPDLAPPASSAATAPEPDGLTGAPLYWAVLSVAMAITMTVLDSSIANIALPAIARDFGAQPAESIWIVNAYQLAIVVSLLPLASLGEIIGYRRIYQGGLAVFTLASLTCALSHDLLTLSAARTLQGFGAAGVMSVNGALVRFIYPHRLLGRGIGLNAMVVSAASAVGPSVASAILAVAPWPWLFAINIPIGLAALVLARVSLPSNPLADRRFDWISAALNAATFGLVISGVDVISRTRSKLLGVMELAGGLAVGALLVLREWPRPRPLVPIDLLRNRTFALSIATSIASFAAQMLAFVCLPFHFENALGRGQVETGLLMTPWPVAVALTAPAAGWLADRVSTAVLCGVGLAVFSAGLAALAFMPADASSLEIGWRMAVCGFGFGLFQAPNNRMMLTSAPRERAGAAGGMLATARLTGQTTGAVLTAILLHLMGAHGEFAALACASVFAIVAAGFSLLRMGGGKAASASAAA